MPTSRHEQITKIVHTLIALKPSSVLDVGVGFGKYGVLAREYLEMWDGDMRYDRHEWKCTIDGVEVCESYITPLHKYVYDRIFVGDIRDVIHRLDTQYDLVLAIDVLEHFEVADGIALIDGLLNRSCGILVCVPKRFYKQGPIFGNPFETHRAQWDKKDFCKHWPCVFIADQNKNIVLVGECVVALWRSYQRDQLRNWIRKRLRFVRKLFSLVR